MKLPPYPLLYLLLLFVYTGCKPEKQAASEWTTEPNHNRNPKGYARRLEMPRLESDNIFNCYTTSFEGKEAYVEEQN